MKKIQWAALVAVLCVLSFSAGLFSSKVHKELGGDQLTVESGGEISIIDGGIITDDGTQASAISDLDAGAQTAFEDIFVPVNAIITALEGVGILVDN